MTFKPIQPRRLDRFRKTAGGRDYAPSIKKFHIDTHALTGVVLKSKFKLRLTGIFLALHLYVFLYDTFLDTYRGHEVAL